MRQLIPFRSISRRLNEIYTEERALFCLGLLGIVLGLIGLAVMALRGQIIPPEGYLYKAASFDIAIGIYILTIILFIPLADFSARGRRLWRWSSVALTLYAYAIENIQIYRGLDPRFSRVGSVADNLAGTIFGGVALGLVIMFLILVRRFFSRRNAMHGSPLLLALRYGCAAVLLAFFTGILMGAINGAKVGATGNLLPLHAAGFHGLQAVPLVALLFDWAHVPAREAKAWVHAAGLSWLGACAGIAWQTALGRSVAEGSTATYLALAMLLSWLVCALAASIGLRRDASVRYPA
jgi:hypothetical protein